MPERVIAFDPGHRTGWARATLAENSITDLEHGVTPVKETAVVLHTSMASACSWAHGDDSPLYDVIVYETWRPRPQNGSMNWIQGNQLIEVQLIGQLRLAGWLYGAKLVGYGPDRKAPALRSMPEALKTRMASCHEQHDQDALMHLWAYAFENWVTDPTKLTID